MSSFGMAPVATYDICVIAKGSPRPGIADIVRPLVLLSIACLQVPAKPLAEEKPP